MPETRAPAQQMQISRLIAQRLDERDHPGPLCIGICGRAGAGKTTIAGRIAGELSDVGVETRHYSGDWRFIHDSERRKGWLAERWAIGPQAYLAALNQFTWWDFDRIADDLDRLRDGQPVRIEQAYDRTTGKRDREIDVAPIRSGVICYENCVLGGHALLERLDLVVVLNTPDALCMERILARDGNRRTVPEIAARLLVTSYSEDRFFALLFDRFEEKIVPCDSGGRVGRLPRFEPVRYMPVPIPEPTVKRHRRGVVFCDLDGTLIRQSDTPGCEAEEISVLDGAERLRALRSDGYHVILTTSRPEGSLSAALDKLTAKGIQFDQVLSDLPLGPRHLVCDHRDDGMPQAIAHPLRRDQGIGSLDLEAAEGAPSGSELPAPLPLERAAMALLAITACLVFLVKINSLDTPWHLATARLAANTGEWPTTNTFSYVHGDAPMNHLYPLYQSLLWHVYRAGGWNGLSVLQDLLWLAPLALWIAWGGGFRQASLMTPLWLFAVYGLHLRRSLRPEMLTSLWLATLLLLFEQYRRGKHRSALVMTGVLWAMANSQPTLFPLGLGLLASFAIHLVVVRAFGGSAGIAAVDREVPLWPIVGAFAASIGVCTLTPTGPDLLSVPLRMLASFDSYGARETIELASVFAFPATARLAYVGIALCGVWAYLSRGRVQPYEAAVAAMGVILLLSALRGLPFFCLIAAALAGRAVSQHLGRQTIPASLRRHAGSARLLCVAITFAACGSLLYHWLWQPNRTLHTPQSGLGRSSGGWSPEMIRFLRESPPPGRVLNLPWTTGNALIFGLYPAKQVYVDPRFESFPRGFVGESMAAMHDQKLLDRLIARHRPSWMVVELRFTPLMRRVRTLIGRGSWLPVHLSAEYIVLVERASAPRYVMRNRIDLATGPIHDLEREAHDIRGLQLINLARALRILGAHDRAQRCLDKARALAHRYPAVANRLATASGLDGGAKKLTSLDHSDR